MEFYSVDTLTGRVAGRLAPHHWELNDPLRGVGTGTLNIAIPWDPAAVGRLAELTQQRRRWVAACEGGQPVWCGPIVEEPSRSEGVLTVSVADWRTWFYHAVLRPVNGVRQNYIKVGTNAHEQTLIIYDLMKLALATTGVPDMVVDLPPLSGVEREITALMLDRYVAEYLDSVTAVGAFDWWVYCVQTDPTQFKLHATACWPERFLRGVPVKLEWQLGKGGNAVGVTWPGGQGAATRVWALGEGEPPDQPYSFDEYGDIDDGTDVTWESVIGPLDGVRKAQTLFDHAHAAITQSQGLDRTIEFVMAAEKLPLTSVGTGDRARIVYSDGWTDVDIPSARIVSRTMSGGRGEATLQRLSVDLSDDIYPDDDSGEDVS